MLKDLLKQPPDVPMDTKQVLFYAGGYIAFKHPELRGDILDFSEDLTAYLDTLDRGNLSYPSPELFEFFVYSFAYFERSKEGMCVNRYLTILKVFPNFFDFDIALETKPLRRIANILFKRFALFSNEVFQSNKVADCTCKKVNKVSSNGI